MKDNMNLLKRLTAFLLCMLLFATTMGNDLFAFADDTVVVEESVVDAPEAAAPAEEAGGGEAYAGEAGGSEAGGEEVSEVVEEVIQENPEENSGENPDDNTAAVGAQVGDVLGLGEGGQDEEGGQSVDETGLNSDTPAPEENPENIGDNEDSQNDIDDVDDDENDDETDVDEEELEDDADKDKVHEHHFEYVPNGDGTHTKRCVSEDGLECDCEETVEDCEFEDGVCKYCGYEEPTEEEKVEFYNVSVTKRFGRVNVTVVGELPKNAEIVIDEYSVDEAEVFLENHGQGDYEIFKAFNIQIYVDGIVYQPEDDGREVKVTVEGVSELEDVPDANVEVLRVNHDSSVEELPSVVDGDQVTFNSEHFSYVFIGTKDVDNNVEPQDYIEVSSSEMLSMVLTASGSKYHQVNTVTFYVLLEDGDIFDCTGSIRANLTDSLSPSTGNLVGVEQSEVISAEAINENGTGWYRVVLDFSAANNRWVSPDKYYSINIYGFSGKIAYGITGANSSATLYKTPLGTDNSSSISQKGVFIVNETEEAAPTDIEKINISSKGLGRTIYTTTNAAAHYTGEIYYVVGETDTIGATLTPDYSRTLTWTVETQSGTSPISLTGTASGERSITANSAGKVKLTVSYSADIYAELNIIVLQPYVADSINYSVEYNGKAHSPAVKLYDGTTNYTSASGEIGSVVYDSATNTKAGTAKITVPFTKNGITYNFQVTYTIAKKALTWATNFQGGDNTKITFDIDVENNVVNDVSGAVSGIDDVALEFGTDYTVTLSNKTYPSDGGISYTVTINEGSSGNYSASGVSGTYKIDTSARDVNNYFEVQWQDDISHSFEYTGREIKDLDWDSYFIFYYKNTTNVASNITTANTTATYTNNVDAGTATISFKVSGYDGTLELNFEIYALSITNESEFKIEIKNEDNTEVTSGYAKYTHTGKAIKPDAYENASGVTEDHIVVTYGEDSSGNPLVLTKGTDYTVSYSSNVNVGTAIVTITGKGNFVGQKEAYFTIEASFADDAEITVNSTNKANAGNNWVSGYATNYRGTKIQPTVIVRMNGAKINAQTSPDSTTDGYYLTYADEINADNTVKTALTSNAGTKYVVCLGTGRYKGTNIAASYIVRKINIRTNSAVALNIINNEFTFTGNPIELTETADYTLKYTYGSTVNTLVNGTDYDITFENNVNAGTATFTITGKDGNYTDVLTGTYTINPATLTDSMITLDLTKDADDFYSTAYTGQELEPVATVTFNGNSMGSSPTSTNFTVKYDDNISVGTAKVTVTGKGNLTGSGVVNFKITSKSIASTTIKLEGYEVPATKDTYGNYYCAGYKPTYTGKTNQPIPELRDGSTILRKSVHYTVDYKNTKTVADYTSYAAAGTAEANASQVIINGIGNYAGTKIIIYFDIEARDISASTVSVDVPDIEWTGDKTGTDYYTPTIDIKDNGTDLLKGLQGITVAASNYELQGDTTAQTAGGGYTVTITGKGNYKGTKTATYSVGHDISEAEVSLANPFTGQTYTKDGDIFQISYMGEHYPNATITANGTAVTSTQLTETSRTASGLNSYNSYGSTNVVTVKLTGTNGCYGDLTYLYKINQVDLTNADKGGVNGVYISTLETEGLGTLEFIGTNWDVSTVMKLTHTATSQTIASGTAPAPTGTEGTDYFKENLKYGEDYVIAPRTIGPDRGSTTVTVRGLDTGKGNYTGSFNYSFTIGYGKLDTISINEDSVTVFKKDDGTYYAYYNGGTEITFNNRVVVKNSQGQTLTEGTDYTLTYTDNVNVSEGTTVAKITATGINNYQGSTTATPAEFKIVAIDVEGDTDFNVTLGQNVFYYDGLRHDPTVVVTYKGVALQENTDYTVTYPSETGKNTYPGSATATTPNNYVTVTGKGVYKGTKVVPFNIYLDLSKTTYVQITKDKDYYTMSETPSVTVQYKDSTGTTILGAINIDAGSDKNFKADAIATQPGLGKIKVTGLHDGSENCCTGEYTITDVPFKGDIKDYVRLSKTDFAYTGQNISLGNALYVAYGAEGTDYEIIYNESDQKSVGPKTVTVRAKAGSEYYIPGSTTDVTTTSGGTTTVTKLTYYVKYNLDELVINDTLKVLQKGTDAITYDAVNKYYWANYAGSPIGYGIEATFGGADSPQLTKDTTPGNSYLKFEDTGLNAVGTKYITISVDTAGKDYVMGGPVNIKLVIKGRDISTYYCAIKKTDGTYDITGSYPFTGKEIRPDVLVKPQSSSADSEKLTLNTHYTIEYSNAVDVTTSAKKAYVTITGIESAGYSGTKTLTYDITAVDIANCDVTFEPAYYAGAGVPVRPALSITNGTTKLVEGTDYKIVKYESNTGNIGSVGNVVIEAVTGSNYTGTIDGTNSKSKFTIEALNLKSTTVYATSTKNNDEPIDTNVGLEVEYTGQAQPINNLIKVWAENPYYDSSISTDVKKTELVYSATSNASTGDYTIAVLDQANNSTEIKEMGTYTVKISGINNCQENFTFTVTVAKRSLADNYHYYYSTEDGFKGTFKFVKDMDGDKTSAVEPGIVTTGGKDGDSLTVYIYDVTTVTEGAANIPKVAIIDSEVSDSNTTSGNYELVEGTDFTISVINANEVGTAEWSAVATTDYHAPVAASSPAVVITGMGNYTDSITIPFNIGKNINTLGLTITYNLVNENSGLSYFIHKPYGADATDSSETVAWHYTFNGETQVPDVTVMDGTNPVPLRNYSITYTNEKGVEDESINAGYKYVVITGKGDYCGTIKQKYCITRKAIVDAGGPYQRESATEQWITNAKQLKFEITSGDVTKLKDAADVKKNLVDTGLIKENDPILAEFINTYYAIYDGEAITPSVKVTDNTLGSDGKTSLAIDESDLDITYARENQVIKINKDNVTGEVTTYELAEIRVRFKTPDENATATDPTTGNQVAVDPAENFSVAGNYYVGTGGSATYVIKYLIINHDIDSDFYIQILNGLNNDRTSFDAGKPRVLDIRVTNGTRILDEGVDYEVSYKDENGNLTNVVPGKATLTVTGIGNYRGVKTKDFYIDGDLAETTPYYKNDNDVLVPGIPLQQYTGEAITCGDPEIFLVLEKQGSMKENVILQYGVEYDIRQTPTSNTDFTADGTVIYSGIQTEYWTGDLTVEYSVKFSSDKVTIPSAEEEYEYTGYEIKPKIVLSVNAAVFSEDEVKFYRDGDKSRECDDFTTPGTITIEVPYKIGTKYTGTAVQDYEIVERPLSNCTIVMSKSQRYTGRAVKPSLTVLIKSNNLQTGAGQIYTLKQDTDYTVDYGNYVSGNGIVDLTAVPGNNKVCSEAHPSYVIRLHKVVNLEVPEDGNTGNSLTVTWTRDIYSDGTKLTLQLWDESLGDYVDYKSKTVEGKTTKYTFTGLTSSTKYRIKAVAYAAGTEDSDPTYYATATDIATSDIVVESNTPGIATITWPNSGDATLYYIYRRDESTPETIVAIIPRSALGYTNSGLSTGKTYEYKIVGYVLENAELIKISESNYTEVTINY